MTKLRFRKGVFLVVFRKDNKKILYLLLKRKLHWLGWEFPKGGVEKNESRIQAVKRELKEETGLKARKIADMKKKSSFLYPKDFTGWPGFKGMSYHIFGVEAESKKIRLDKIEHAGYKWLDYKQAIKKLTYKEQKQALKLVNEKLSS